MRRGSLSLEILLGITVTSLLMAVCALAVLRMRRTREVQRQADDLAIAQNLLLKRRSEGAVALPAGWVFEATAEGQALVAPSGLRLLCLEEVR